MVVAFTIPKVLSVQANQQRNAVLKETYASMQQILYEGVISNELPDNPSGNYFSSRFNAAIFCPSNSLTQGCWDQTKQGNPFNEGFGGGYVLKNNARVVGMTGNSFQLATTFDPGGYGMVDGFAIDWNGLSGPNQVGEDQLGMLMCVEPIGKNCSVFGTLYKGGTIRPYNDTSPSGPGAATLTANQKLFETITGQ